MRVNLSDTILPNSTLEAKIGPGGSIQIALASTNADSQAWIAANSGAVAELATARLGREVFVTNATLPEPARGRRDGDSGGGSSGEDNREGGSQQQQQRQ